MKKIFQTLSENNFKYLNFNSPDGPDHMEAPGKEKPKAEKDHKAIAQQGLKTVGTNLQNVGKLSPKAATLVGNKLPQTLAGSITNPKDVNKLRSAAQDARHTIEGQMPKPGQKKEEGQAQEKGQEENEISPEAVKEALEWVEAVEEKLAEATQEVQKQLETDPENEDLKATVNNLKNTQKDISRFHQEVKGDMRKVEAFAAQDGVVGTLAQKVAAVAKGEMGKVSNDAQGNAKYTPGGVDQPWCADFVNHCVEQAGGKGTGSSMAQSFVGGSGLGHVGIVTEEGGGTTEGNKGNKVANGNASAFQKAISPEDLAAGNKGAVKSASAAKLGDIVVKSRSGGNKTEA